MSTEREIGGLEALTGRLDGSEHESRGLLLLVSEPFLGPRDAEGDGGGGGGLGDGCEEEGGEREEEESVTARDGWRVRVVF